MNLTDRILLKKRPQKIRTLKNRFLAIFDFFLIFYSVRFSDWLLFIESKESFSQKNHPSNIIFLASRELFLFFRLYLHFRWLKKKKSSCTVDSSLEIYKSRTDKNGPTYAIINGLTGRGKR
jgi:predicted nucleotidyltransferase